MVPTAPAPAYDVLVLGATGFTGQLAAAYLTAKYPDASRVKVSPVSGVGAVCAAVCTAMLQGVLQRAYGVGYTWGGLHVWTRGGLHVWTRAARAAAGRCR